MRQGHHAEALRELDAADRAASSRGTNHGSRFASRRGAPSSRTFRVAIRKSTTSSAAWSRRWSAKAIGRTRHLRCAYASRYCSRARITRAPRRSADRAIRIAEASGDDYVMVQILNVLGAVAFDRATSKLDGPHARAHLSALDPRDTAPMEADAREALRLLRARPRRGRARALRVCGVVRGRQHRAARDPAGQRRARGANDQEAPAAFCRRAGRRTTKSSRARISRGDLRTLGRHREALHELDAALIARARDRHVQRPARVPRIRPLDRPRCAGRHERRARELSALSATRERLESETSRSRRKAPRPSRCKASARTFLPQARGPLTSWSISASRSRSRSWREHCEVSPRTLQKAFADSRGITPGGACAQSPAGPCAARASERRRWCRRDRGALRLSAAPRPSRSSIENASAWRRAARSAHAASE